MLGRPQALGREAGRRAGGLRRGAEAGSAVCGSCVLGESSDPSLPGWLALG